MGNNCCAQNINEMYELSTGQWDVENRKIQYSKVKCLIWKKKETLKAKCKIDVDLVLPDDMIGKQSKLYYKNQQPSNEPNFVDNCFKPDENSIIYVDKNKECAKDILPEEIEAIKGLTWRKPNDLFRGKEFSLFKGIQADDIKQGILGNCYFLSSIAAIAEFKERIENIIVQKEVSENGQYQIRLYLDGKPKIVVVDDYIPCLKNSRNSAFTHCRGADNEIWVGLIEKAWAKVNGSYAMTIAGLPSEGMSSLTEAPTVTYIHKKFDADKIWNILYEADRLDHIICTCTRGEDGLDGTKIDAVGLVPGHAYTIISVFDINKDLKLLKIRNPWGSFEWKGDYSDNSPLWTDDLKKKVNYLNLDDGSFYMRLTDFLNFFPYSFICKYERGFYYNYKKYVQFPDETLVATKIVITKPTKIMINLHQKSLRSDTKMPNYHLNMSRIIICKYEKTKTHCYTYVKSHASKLDKLHLQFSSLEPGEYHIFSHVNWPFEGYKNSYVLSTYADSSIELQDLDHNEIPEDFNHLIFYSYLDQHEDKKFLKENLQLQVSYSDNDLGFYMLLFKNSSKTDNFTINFEAILNKNVRLSTDHHNNKIVGTQGDSKICQMTFNVEPETDYLVLYELEDEPWNSKLKINNISVTSFQGAKADPNKNLIRNQLSKIKRIPTDIKGLYYGELESDAEVFLIFINDIDVQAKFQIVLKEYINIKTDQERYVFKIDAHDFTYIKLYKEEKGRPIDFSFDYSAKKLML